MPTTVIDAKLRREIINSLTKQGFYVNGSVQPRSLTKTNLKRIQQHSRKEQIKIQKKFIESAYPIVKKYLKCGNEIDPSKIELELRVVENGTDDEILYRWWNIVWWSVPYQKAYGRQMRFIVWDKTHNAPFGIIGLQSPILKMAVRDKYLQIPNESLDVWINKSMQAQRLGALPPYNQLLGGKMVAMALTSSELRRAYRKKYRNKRTELNNRIIEPDLLFLTTTSAFGRSSVYNRIKYKDQIVAQSIGYTKGSGTFHISEPLYKKVLSYLINNGEYVGTSFGNGPSKKIKTLDKAFSMLKLNNYTFHNIEREFFLFPLAQNLKSVITKNVQPRYYSRPLSQLTAFWKERWCIPRSGRNEEWKEFDSKKFFIAVKKNVTRWSR